MKGAQATQEVQFHPKYVNGHRTCDGPYCNMQKKLCQYITSIGPTLFYCNYHVNDPYNVYGAPRIHYLDKPLFRSSQYQILTAGEDLMCGYVGCKITNDLVEISQNFFCKEHAQDMVNLQLKYVDKTDPHTTLIIKLKEFNSRKILSPKNIRSIHELEALVRVDKKLYSELAVNLVHKEYLDYNYKIFQEYKSKHPHLFNKKYSSSDASPTNSPTGFVFSSESSPRSDKSPGGDRSPRSDKSPVVDRKNGGTVGTAGTAGTTFIRISSKIDSKSIIQRPIALKSSLNRSTPVTSTHVVEELIPTQPIPRTKSSPNLIKSHVRVNSPPDEQSYYVRNPVDFLMNPTYYNY